MLAASRDAARQAWGNPSCYSGEAAVADRRRRFGLSGTYRQTLHNLAESDRDGGQTDSESIGPARPRVPPAWDRRPCVAGRAAAIIASWACAGAGPSLSAGNIHGVP